MSHDLLIPLGRGRLLRVDLSFVAFPLLAAFFAVLERGSWTVVLLVALTAFVAIQLVALSCFFLGRHFGAHSRKLSEAFLTDREESRGRRGL
jgi:hypothetical protein